MVIMKTEPLIILIICSFFVWSEEYNDTVQEVPGIFFSTMEDDTEQELSEQLEEVNDISEGWSSWSQWSPCSRSCDGGVAHQLRTCTIGKCRGKHVQHRICNMQAFVVFFAAVAATFAAPSATIVQGPSARSTLVGVDGSVISSVAPGGSIIAEEHPGVVAQTLPVVAANPAVVSSYIASPSLVNGVAYARSAPVLAAYSSPYASAYSTPVVSSYSAPWVSAYSAYNSPIIGHASAYSAPLVSAYSSPVIGHGSVDTVIAGPSGTISTSRHAEGLVAGHGLYL